MIQIIGARGTIRNVETFVQHISDFSDQEHLVIQVFDARMIFGENHLISATLHARRAFEQGTQATNSLALEILLYAAGERQIQKAIKKIGVTQGKQSMVFLLTDPLHLKPRKTVDKAVIQRLFRTFRLSRDDAVINGDRMTLKRFGITEVELSTVSQEKYGELILEKIALVDVVKK